MDTKISLSKDSGWWLLASMFVIFMIGSSIGLYWGERAFDPSQGPGGDPPFYFIRRDFIQGICMAASQLSVLFVCFVFMKRHPLYSWMTIGMSIIFCGGSIAKLIIIYFKTSNILTPQLSESSWNTFRDYINDPIIWISQGATLFLGLTISLTSILMLNKNQQNRSIKT